MNEQAAIEERAQELREGLYYDLLEKFINLRAQNAQLVSRVIDLKCKNLTLLQNCPDIENVNSFHNKQLDLFLGLCHRNKFNAELITVEIKSLKADVKKEEQRSS